MEWREGFSNVLVEAMICGAKVVSTDCPSGPREVLEDGKWGRLVPVGEPEMLADAIFQQLTQTNETNPFFRVQGFDQKNIVRSYIQYMSEL